MIDRFGTQFVVPGFVAVDLAQPVLGAMFGQPRCGIEVPNVDRVPRHVRRRVRGGDPLGSFLFRAILGDGLAKQLILVIRGTPATIDEELDAVVRSISCSLAQGTEQIGVEVGYTRNLVIKDRRAVRDGTVSLAKRTAVGPVARVSASGSSGAKPSVGPLAEAIWTAWWSRAAISETSSVRRIGAGCQSRTTVLTAKDVDG